MDNKKIINERIENLRKLMLEENIDAYIIPTSDYHGSEYVGEYFKERVYISGFTGSAGTVIVTPTKAGLWTDGRYFLQAEDQLKGTIITLYKMGEKNVPTMTAFLKNELKDNALVGFDGKTLTTSYCLGLLNELASKQIKFKYDVDLIDKIWKDRPQLSKEKAYLLDDKYTGCSRKEKIARVRAYLKENNLDYFVLTSLDDISWLLNIRGNDVECNPVVLSYVTLTSNSLNLYINKEVLSSEIKVELTKDGITIKDYFDIYEDVKNIKNKRVILEENKVNYAIFASLNGNYIVNRMNPTTAYKAVKNDTEIKNVIDAHIKDGVALTKFIYWLKKNVGKLPLTELSASDKLESFRREQEHFMGLSFTTIAGYASHGAIVHYDPTSETDIPLKNESFLLVDSGAQYLEGTTDVTRTIALGTLTKEEKKHYTAVLKGHLALSDAKFLSGTSGCELDMLARRPLWELGLNFNHGTGHGVGYFLNVHEGPQSISNAPIRCSYPFSKGMITSNEPGLYITGKYGIRIENLVLCEDYMETEFGKFLKFRNLTLAPYEIDAINKDELTSYEIKLIHDYHVEVYKVIGKYLTSDEKKWLKDIVEAI